MKNQKFNSVWDAIESTPINAASMQARSKLMMEISSVIERNEMTQTEAAQLFGVTQPRISDLMRGKINLFSLDTLMNMAATAGMAPEVKLSRPKLRVAWVNWGQINIVLLAIIKTTSVSLYDQWHQPCAQADYQHTKVKLGQLALKAHQTKDQKAKHLSAESSPSVLIGLICKGVSPEQTW